MPIDDLLSGSSRDSSKKKKQKKAKPSKSEFSGEKKYKNLYMNIETVEILHKLTFKKKMTDSGHSFSDTVHEALKLLEKQEESKTKKQ